jgi:DNA mismatch repair protein MutS2
MVQAGMVRLRVPVDQLRPVSKAAAKASVKPKTIVHAVTGSAERSVKSEVDVRGLALDEAMAAVDSYLDNAVLAGLNEVFIIHGKGTGTLRSGLKTHLHRHPHIAEQRAGRYGEGEAGVTVVRLK